MNYLFKIRLWGRRNIICISIFCIIISIATLFPPIFCCYKTTFFMGVSMTFATLAGSLLIFRTLSIQAQALQVQQKELKIQERNNHRTNIELSYRRMIELIMKK